MGADIAWLLPAAVICLVAGLILTRRAPRTDPTRAALVLWGGWLVVTAVVFSYMNGIVHPYYTVALAPAIAAGIGIGATLLWQRRNDIRAATARWRARCSSPSSSRRCCCPGTATGCRGFARPSRSREWARPC